MVLLGWLALHCTFRAHADRIQPLAVPVNGKTGFTRQGAEQTGILFTNWLSDSRAATNRNLLSGSGVAAGDVDGDGRVDLYFCALDNGNALYRNLGGWRFENATVAAGLECPGWDSTGAAFADVDGDTDLDLLVNTLGHGTHLFVNDGRGKFTRNAGSGLKTGSGSTSLALADMDGDSDLDLYVTNFRVDTIRDRPSTRFSIEHINNLPVVARVNGRPASAPDLTNRFSVSPLGEVVEFGEADVLYENDGTGRFTVVSFTGGRFRDESGQPLRQPPLDWGLAVQFRDFTGDGVPDLYVCNDYWTPDRIWINDGKGHFRAAASIEFRSTSRSSMGVDFADIDRDGDADCLVVDMLARDHRRRQIQVSEVSLFSAPPGPLDLRLQVSQNTLQLNRGDGTFAQIGEYCGLEGTEWSWCPIFMDVDLDGWEDVLVSNGHRRDFLNADATTTIHQAIASRQVSMEQPWQIMALYPELQTRTAAFRNEHDLTFSDASESWGLVAANISHGFCTADLDDDGDLDLIMNNLGSAAGLYRNDSHAARISVRLRAAGKNTFGIGAQVTVQSGPLAQMQELLAGGRYLSSDAAERVFAAPSHGQHSILVRWRSGRVQEIKNAAGNTRYVICEETSSNP